ncbi:MAG: response regulator [Candidatus Delongbacteria bacterium]|nr:response regulator [Candidatus Delongbacteria bacterium]MBN2836796.1 response regulator [Candidatus Delongbacteria bacterium]
MKKDFKILVIEDDTVHRTVLETILTDDGYDVITATDGKDGLDKVLSEKVDLVITDIRMPLVDGYQVCKVISENPSTKFIPVVILTANHETEDLVYGFKQGAFDYILKPFDNSELTARINAAIKYKELRDELIGEKQKSVLYELAGAAAHELNQPLTVLKTIAYIIEDRLNKKILTNDDVFKYMDKMKFAVDRMSKIITKMQNLSEYKTKNYAMGQKIINLVDSGESDE